MSFQWLKRYMPRGLYGRAALILLLPVLTLQLVVFVLFAERHFSDVTTQMTGTMVRELHLVFDVIEDTDDPAALPAQLQSRLGRLDIDVDLVPANDMPSRDTRLWYDYSGTVFGPQLRAAFPDIQRVLLRNDEVVVLFADTRHGLARVEIGRGRFSASRPHQLFIYMIFFGVLMTLIAYIYLRNQ